MTSPFISLRQPAKEGIRLFCFAHAGGGASVFRRWPGMLPAFIEPVAVRLPGRESRFTEQPYDRMAPLVAHLTDSLSPWLDRPYACFGFSMGARVALALAQTLRDRGLPAPSLLFVGGSPGPGLPIEVPGWKDSDEGLVAQLRRLGGIPPEPLTMRELLSVMLPTVRADLTVLATWTHQASTITTPIHAFAGVDDDYAPPARMMAWEQETEGWFRLTRVPGGHFFLQSQEEMVLGAVAADLARCRAGDARG